MVRLPTLVSKLNVKGLTVTSTRRKVQITGKPKREPIRSKGVKG